MKNNLNSEKILIIIPAYNEELNINYVITDIKKYKIEADILIINDASEDNTFKIAIQNNNINILNLNCNLGIGGAVQTGYIYAWENSYDIAIQFDGDGQHSAEDLKNLINTFKEKNLDMIIGSRFLNPKGFKSSFFRRIGIIYFSKLISFILKIKITDPTSGFRIVNKKLIELFTKYYPDDYPEPEVLVFLHKKNAKKIKEIPVKMRKRIYGESSIQLFNSIYYMIKVSLAILINLIRSIKTNV